MALIFDCDGTLTDSMPVHFLCWQKTMRSHGIEFAEERFYALGGMPSDKIVELLAGELGLSLDCTAVAAQKEQAFLETLHLLEPIAAVVEVARENRGKRKMAVASGGFRHVIEKQLRQVGIYDWFDALVTAEDTPRHKPEPDVFLEAARRLGAAPAECLVYEDSDLGIEAARRAGMPWIDVRTLHTPRKAAAP
ncbi:MAG TPA: HAD family phosphatase [Pirellulaceae bacterium]|nr:HAD family phosphatase [Pirellulaceae bacterium]